jgi:hypothetical protein
MKSTRRSQAFCFGAMPDVRAASYYGGVRYMLLGNHLSSILVWLRNMTMEFHWEGLFDPSHMDCSEQPYSLRENFSELKIYLRYRMKELEPHHLDIEPRFGNREESVLFHSRQWPSSSPLMFRQGDTFYPSGQDSDHHDYHQESAVDFSACDLILSLLRQLDSIEACQRHLIRKDETPRSGRSRSETACLICLERIKYGRETKNLERIGLGDPLESKIDVRSKPPLFEGHLHTLSYGYSKEPQQRYLFWTLDSKRIQCYNSYGNFINGDAPLQSYRVSEICEIRRERPSQFLIYTTESDSMWCFCLKTYSDDYVLWSSKESELENFMIRLAFVRCRYLENLCRYSFRVNLQAWACLQHGFATERKPIDDSKKRRNSKNLTLDCGVAHSYSPDSSLGSFFDVYQIVDHLGHGSFGFVKKVRRRSDGKLFAAKFLEKSKVKVRDDHDHPFEIVTLFSISHPNIVKPIEVYDHQDFMALVMQLHGNGDDLFDLIERSHGGLNEDTAKLIFRQVLDAACYLSENGYLHGDIKDENVIMDPATNHVTLVDFGSCYRYTPSTEQSIYYGSEKNAAPEVLSGGPFQPEAQEIWSLGTLLYSILFGEDPSTAYQYLSPDTGEFGSSLANSRTLELDSESSTVPPRSSLPSISEACQNLLRRLLGPLRDRQKSLKEILRDPWLVTCHSRLSH